VLGKELGCKLLGIQRKLERMGVVVDKRKIRRTTTTEIDSIGLLTHEEALKLLACS
jgi:hypothetical protein